MSHAHPPDDAESARRLRVDVGITALNVLALVGLYHALTGDAAPGVLGRAAACLAAGLLFGELSGLRLFKAEAEYKGLPLARFSSACAAVYLLAAATFDAFAAAGIPAAPGAFVLVGLSLLGVSVWADSTLAAMIGAEFVDGAFTARLARFFGYAGGYATQGIFFYLLVSLAELPLGYYLTTRVRRSLGLGVMVNAGLSATYCLLYLGMHGPGYHGEPTMTWISAVYFLAALALSVGFVRVTRRYTKGAAWDLSSRAVIVTISLIADWAGAPGQLSWMIGLMGYWVMESAGVFEVESADEAIALTPDLLQDPERLQAVFAKLAAKDPTTARLGELPQTRVVRGCLAGSLVGVVGVLAAGFANRALPSREAFRIPVGAAGVEAAVAVRTDVEHHPEDLPRGAAVDVYLTPRLAEKKRLYFSDEHVVARGAPPPDDVDPDRAWRFPGRVFRCRDFQGKTRRGISYGTPLRFALPPALAAGEGDWLVFRRGALGYPYFDRVAAGPGEPPATASAGPGATPEAGASPEAGAAPAPPGTSWLGGPPEEAR